MYGYISFIPLWEIVSLVAGFWWRRWRRFEKVARSGTTRSRHRDHRQPLIYILSTAEPASRALCFGMPMLEARRGVLFLRRPPVRSLARFYVSNSVQIQTPVLSAEPPTSISPRTPREGVGVMHSHFSNSDTLTAVLSYMQRTCNHDSSLIRTFLLTRATDFLR